MTVAPAQQMMGGLNQMMGGATAAVNAALGVKQGPTQIAMNLEGGLFKAGDRYVLNPFGIESPGCMDVCCLVCCPCCTKRNLMYFTLEGKIMNVHNPGNCCCKKPWQISMGQRNQEKRVVAKVKLAKPKCCSSPNGFAFSTCGKCCGLPMCQCSGHLKHLVLLSADNQERWTVLQELVPCWCIAFSLAGMFTPCGKAAAGCDACCNFCSGRFIRDIEQPIYGPLESRSDPPRKVGGLSQQHMMMPVNCCCAAPCQSIKVVYRKEGGEAMDEDDIGTAALLIAMFKGLFIPDLLLPVRPPFPQPMGVKCTDMGLHSQVKYLSVMDALKDGVFDM